MLSTASAYLGAGFFCSEAGLAIWRRVSSKDGSKDRDAGSLRMLWIVILASVSAAVVLAARGAGPWLPAALPWKTFGTAVFVLGTALRWWSVWHLGRFFTVNVAVADDHRLVDTGPYRLIRHPSYAGLVLQFAGFGCALGTLPPLLVVLVPPTLAILHRIRIEEAVLRAHLTGAYAAYEARTKKMVPQIF